MRFALSAFADEISPSLDTQVATLKRLGVAGLDLRSVEGTNVLDLSEAQLDEVAGKCADNGLHVQAIGSPVNKVKLTAENRPLELAKLRRAIFAAKRTGTDKIRIFSPEVPRGQDAAAWPQVRDWMEEQIEEAGEHGILLLHENDAVFYGAYPDNARRLFDALGSDTFKAAFDFANTVLIGYRPMQDWFPWILPHLHTLHIKDANKEEHKVYPAGKGEGQIEEALRWLTAAGWQGPLTIEPHLASAGALGGFSGEQLFEVAVASLREVAERAGVEC